MKGGNIIMVIVLLLTVGVITADRMYVSKFTERFKEIEKKRIITSNKLATAKIVHENLYHVRDLVMRNMILTGVNDSVNFESDLFQYLTTCVNDLKLKLIEVSPGRPSKKDRVETVIYDVEIEGDFFNFGELCAKLENSRRIISLKTYSVVLADKNSKKEKGTDKNNRIRVKMGLETYLIDKYVAPQTVAVKN